MLMSLFSLFITPRHAAIIPISDAFCATLFSLLRDMSSGL